MQETTLKMSFLSYKTQNAAAEPHLEFPGTFAALFPSSTSSRSSQNDSAGFCLCAVLKHAGNEIGNRERRIKCDTIQVYILCPLAQGIYGRKEHAHRNPLMEPDYLFALKLIECRAERGEGVVCVCLCM